MKKGLGVVVAQKINGQYYTDTICNCDAMFLSITTPVVLQTADFSKVAASHTLYLCGHGNKSKRTISGYRIKEIAQMLVQAHYSGQQEIAIASCHSLCKRHGKSMADELQEALKALGVQCSCKAVAKGTTVVLESKTDNVVTGDIPFKLRHAQIFATAQSTLFGRVEIPAEAYNMRKNREHFSDDVDYWNRRTLERELDGALCVCSNTCSQAASLIVLFVLTAFLQTFGVTEIPVLTWWLGCICAIPVTLIGFSGFRYVGTIAWAVYALLTPTIVFLVLLGINVFSMIALLLTRVVLPITRKRAECN